MNLNELKQTSILDFGQQVYGLTPVRKRTNYWGFKDSDYDSIMVDVRKNCFYHNSEFVVGEKASSNNNSAGSIIDFIMNVENCSTADAIKKLRKFNNDNSSYANHVKNKYKVEKKKFVPPVKYKYCSNARRYLCGERKIERIVFNYLVKRKMLYEEKGKYKNAVFAAYNNKGKMIFAQRCSTLKNIDSKKRKYDISGSSYKYCYFVNNRASSLIVSEATIDSLSFMSLQYLYGKKFNNYNHLGLAGSNKIVAIYNILNEFPHITKLYLGFDNDEAGIKAYNNVVSHLEKIGWCGQIIDCIPSVPDKDLNDVLKDYKNGIIDKKIERIIKEM